MNRAALSGRAYRLIRLAAALLLTAVFWGCHEDRADGVVRIGLPEEPRTLNIWLASDTNSRKILSQIYQPLYLRDPKTLKLIPWLAAADPIYDAGEMSYTVRLRNARWSDGTRLTADDVIFTAWVINEFKVPRYAAKWAVIQRIETPDQHTVKFYLKKPVAIFHARTLTTPIVSRSEWQTLAENALTTAKPLRTLQNYEVTRPVGTGPFVLTEYRKGAYLHLEPNPYFFGTGQVIGGYLLGPYVKGIVFKLFGTADVAVLSLQKGGIDMFWASIQPGYLPLLKQHRRIKVYHNQKSALYYMGFNLRKAPFDDSNLRRAIATVIDKTFIVSRILQGYGTPMPSFIPPANSFWFNPHVPQYGKDLPMARRVESAGRILADAGYTWDRPPSVADGRPVPGQGLRLPDGAAMQKFTILTPPADYDPRRAFCGLMIQEWLRQLGMPAFARPMSFSSLLDQVKGQRDFDAFILGYGSLNLDPDYLRSFFSSKNDKPRGWNMSGYRNARFDAVAAKSSEEMDREKRREMVWEMQHMLIEDVPYIPLYNPDVLEAVNKERFFGWVEMVEGIGNIWSFCTLKPL